MILERLRVRNFLIHEETEISPRDVTVLVGANGSGKSALIDDLFLAGRLARGPIERSFEPRGPWSFDARRRHGAPEDAPVGLSLDFKTDQYSALATYDVELRKVNDRVVIGSERLLAGSNP